MSSDRRKQICLWMTIYIVFSVMIIGLETKFQQKLFSFTKYYYSSFLALSKIVEETGLFSLGNQSSLNLEYSTNTS